MNPTHTAVPTDPSAIPAWAENFEARYGVPPLGGGESQPGGPAVATPPAPEPAQAATPAPQAQPGSPSGEQPAQGTSAPDGQQAPAEGQPPQWAQTLLERMDEMAPAAPVDPLAAELFGYEQPQQGQVPPGYDPNQLAGQVPGQAMPGQAPQPGLPGQPAVLPGGVPGVPGQPDLGGLEDPGGVVRNFIDERAREVAQTMLRERVEPYLQQQDQQRRRNEAIALTEDYAELRDTAYANALVTRAKQWAQQILGSSEAAGEPGFLELVHLASKQLEVAQSGQGQQPGAGGSEVPIEQPGGANPGAAQTDAQQLADRIVAASPSQGLSSLWK